jgi:hypothetical protein
VIAVPTEEAPNLARYVIMVDMPIKATREGFLANCTDAFTGRDKSLELIVGYAVKALPVRACIDRPSLFHMGQLPSPHCGNLLLSGSGWHLTHCNKSLKRQWQVFLGADILHDDERRLSRRRLHGEGTGTAEALAGQLVGVDAGGRTEGHARGMG